MRTIGDIVQALQRVPTVPGSAKVVLRYSNGITQQEQATTLTHEELQSLAAAATPTPAVDGESVEPSVEDAWGALDRAVCRDARFKDDGVVKHQMDLLSATLASLARLHRTEGGRAR